MVLYLFISVYCSFVLFKKSVQRKDDVYQYQDYHFKHVWTTLIMII